MKKRETRKWTICKKKKKDIFSLFTYTHEVGISSSTDEVTEDAEQLLLEAIVDVRLGPKRPTVGLRTRRRRAKAPATPGSSSFLFSMAV